MPSYLPKRCKTAMAQLYIRTKVSSEKSVIYMHKHQNMKGENETLQFPRCNVAFTTFLHQTPCGFAWCLFPPGERVSLPCRLIRHKGSPRGPADQSAPGQDRTYQKRTSTKHYRYWFSRDAPRCPCAITPDSVIGSGHGQEPRTLTEVQR